jgi:hypothetical protein
MFTVPGRSGGGARVLADVLAQGVPHRFAALAFWGDITRNGLRKAEHGFVVNCWETVMKAEMGMKRAAQDGNGRVEVSTRLSRAQPLLLEIGHWTRSKEVTHPPPAKGLR